MLKDKQREQYVREGGVKCPYCRSPNISTCDQVETDQGCAWQNVVCNDCGKQWTDEYALTGITEDSE